MCPALLQGEAQSACGAALCFPAGFPDVVPRAAARQELCLELPHTRGKIP